MLRAASEVIGELSNPQPVPEVTQKKSQEFLNQLRKIHDSLSHQIAYLSKVGSSVAHSSSVYGLEKDYELCLQELDVVSNKVNTLLQSTQKTAANGHFQ
jgi:archaellum component FlaC